MSASTTFHAEFAWLGGDEVARDVLIDITDGMIARLEPDSSPPAGCERLRGMTMPGLVNSHSHVFHRALRGHTHEGAGDFWEWRSLMYRVAESLDPELLYTIALATYTEMALAGITTVGEFHYLHHDTGGSPYDNPNETGESLIRAANDAGIRITLLDTCYLQGDVYGAPLSGVQMRFGDGDWTRWIERIASLSNGTMARIGAAMHSVRAVPREAMQPIGAYATGRGLPLHVHLSEQQAENEACLERFGRTPTEVFADEGVWGPETTAVHATHVTNADISILGGAGVHISMCCTTERDLADGVGPAKQLAAAGSPLCLGSDSHAVIDIFEEARGVELDERLVTGRRGHFQPHELLTAATVGGASSLGWNSGKLAVGSLADLITIDLDTPRTAGARSGSLLGSAVFAATSSDVSTVVVGGHVVVADGVHRSRSDAGPFLSETIERLLRT